jgi:thioester reductase-like protein
VRFITDWLDAWADAQPGKKLFGFVGADGSEQDVYSYVRFAEVTRRLADWLRHQGLQRGERVVLAYPPGLDMIAAFFACARAGIIAVPAARQPAVAVEEKSGGRSAAALARISAIASDCGAHVVLTDRLRSNPASGAASGLRWLGTTGFETTDIAVDVADACDGGSKFGGQAVGGRSGSFADTPSPVLFLQYTSGATGSPRGVIVSHENIIANARAVLGHVPVGTRHAETGVSWLPQHHDMGLIGYYLFPVIIGGTTIGLSPLEFLRRPALWLQTIARVRGTYASSPNFGFEHCLRPGKISEAELVGVDLSSLRWLMSAAEPVQPATRECFIARFARFGLKAELCVAAYGLAENTLAATHYGRRAFNLEGAARIASCGAPLPGVELRIVDPVSRRALGERSIGEVWLAGPSVCVGYWGVPAEACETFGQRLAGGEETFPPPARWLRTGDLGFVDGGEVFICGRSKDVIIVRGANHYPQDIEAVVEDVPGVRPGSAAAFGGTGGTLAVMVETPAGRPPPDPAEIARAVQVRCQILPATVVLVRPGSIVRTTSGKLARVPTRERFADGAVSVLLTWHPDAEPDGGTVAELRARFDALLSRCGPGAEAASLAEAGLDSLMLTELLLSLERIARGLGADGLAEELDLELLQRLSVGRLRRLLDELEEGGAGTFDAIGGELRHVRDEAAAGTARQMRTDARLEPVCAEAGTAGAAHMPAAPRAPVTDVLLTGATGFFGPFLLESLLRQTGWRFRVLVRAEGAGHARRRVRTAMAGAGLLPAALANGLEARVECVCGDIALFDWGLEPEAWLRLAGQVQAVIHNAAGVNWVANYETLKPANIEGTRTMLRFAQTGLRKRVHHISSTFIFGWTARGVLVESDSNDVMADLDFGYAQTKWVAEQLVLAARSQGVDARIYRPAIVSASTEGMGHPADVAVRVLAFMINHGIAVDTANQLSILPVDVAADNIAAIIGQDDPPARTFHVTTDYYNIVDLTQVLTAEHGYDFIYHNIPGFIAEMNRRCTKTDPLYPLLDFFNGSAARIAAMQLKRYSNRDYREARARAGSGRADPALSTTVASIVSYLRTQGVVRDPSDPPQTAP